MQVVLFVEIFYHPFDGEGYLSFKDLHTVNVMCHYNLNYSLTIGPSTGIFKFFNENSPI